MFIQIEKLICSFHKDYKFKDEESIRQSRLNFYEKILDSENHSEIIDNMKEYILLAFKPHGLNGGATYNLSKGVFSDYCISSEIVQECEKICNETQLHFYVYAIKVLLEKYKRFKKLKKGSP